MSMNDNIAIAAHLHVLLRRKTCRVTDVEWLAKDAAYATEIIRFSRAKASEENAPELADWAAKLENALANQPAPMRPTLFAMASQAVRNLSSESRPETPATNGITPLDPTAGSGLGASQHGADGMQPNQRRADPDASRYVKSLR